MTQTPNDAFRQAHPEFNDETAELRYLGEFESAVDVCKHLFEVSNPHLSLNDWPLSHIDWDAASKKVDTDSLFFRYGNHWWDTAQYA